MNRADRAALERLCQFHGVLPRYRDALGRLRVVPAPALRQILALLGCPTAPRTDFRAVLRAERERRGSRMIEPVVVIARNRPARINLRLTLPLRASQGEYSLTLENGTVQHGKISIPREATESARGRPERYQTYFHLNPRPPIGYHRLEVRWDNGVTRAWLLSTPPSIPTGSRGQGSRSWGLFVPLYALHTNRTWGCGDFSALGEFARWAHRSGATLVGTLPLLSADFAPPFDPSPYRPVSRSFWNEMYLDVTLEPEFRQSRKVRRLFHSREFQRELTRLRRQKYIDFRAVTRLKRYLLEAMLSEFLQRGSRRRAAFERFSRREERLEAYARFRAFRERIINSVRAHETPGTSRASPERANWPNGAYQRYVQWLCHRQLSRLAAWTRRHRVRLYFDLPLGVHPQGFDAWWDRNLFVQEATVGAPPDPGFADGQDWGIAPPHPQKIRENGYQSLAMAVRKHLRVADVLRIDHVMGLHRLFWIARGSSPDGGVYVKYRSEELYAVLAIEAARQDAVIVGEDLGTVPAEVRPALARHGVLRSYVSELEWDDPTVLTARPIRSDAVASLNTHDMPPFHRYWNGKKVRPRTEPHLGPNRTPSTVQKARDWRTGFRSALEILARSPARFLLLNLEDFWGEMEPQNIPGTGIQRRNFSRRTRYSMSEMARLPFLTETLRALDGWRADRNPP